MSASSSASDDESTAVAASSSSSSSCSSLTWALDGFDFSLAAAGVAFDFLGGLAEPFFFFAVVSSAFSSRGASSIFSSSSSSSSTLTRDLRGRFATGASSSSSAASSLALWVVPFVDDFFAATLVRFFESSASRQRLRIHNKTQVNIGRLTLLRIRVIFHVGVLILRGLVVFLLLRLLASLRREGQCRLSLRPCALRAKELAINPQNHKSATKRTHHTSQQLPTPHEPYRHLRRLHVPQSRLSRSHCGGSSNSMELGNWNWNWLLANKETRTVRKTQFGDADEPAVQDRYTREGTSVDAACLHDALVPSSARQNRVN
jgi:hypothetical protein